MCIQNNRLNEQWNGSFEHPKQMIELIDKKTF